MTDEEILKGLKEADDLLGRYKAIATPIAEELAKRQSRNVYGDDTSYRGELGCFEAGDDTICIHLDRDEGFNETLWNKAFAFREMWSKKADEAGIKNIYISGHF